MPGTPHLFDNDMSKAETQAAFKKVLSLFAEHLKGRTATDHTRRFPSPRILERTCELGLTNYRICASN